MAVIDTLARPPTQQRVERTRQNRRLADKVLLAFNIACDVGDVDTAQDLLNILEEIYRRRNVNRPNDRRKNVESLVEACRRLWNLRQGHLAVCGTLVCRAKSSGRARLVVQGCPRRWRTWTVSAGGVVSFGRDLARR